MLKNLRSACLALMAVVAAAESLPAARLSTGGYLWVAWWDPAFTAWINSGNFIDRKLFFTARPRLQEAMVQAGPALALDLGKRVSLSTLFTPARSDRSDTAIDFVIAGGSINAVTNRTNLDVRKYDLDGVLSVGLNRYVQFFGGVKYQHVAYRKNERFVGQSATVGYTDSRLVLDTLGIGLGLGLAIPLPRDFSILAGATGLCQYPLISLRVSGVKPVLSIPLMPVRHEYRPRYYIVGANGALALSYFINAAAVTVTMGFRYQFLYYTGRDIVDMTTRLYLDGKRDHFYGVTLVAVYRIDLTGKRGEGRE